MEQLLAEGHGDPFRHIRWVVAFYALVSDIIWDLPAPVWCPIIFEPHEAGLRLCTTGTPPSGAQIRYMDMVRHLLC
ncbi:MAG: hypothetical protein C7B43_02970 [Sulfobacillus benefaciens]|uniref:Uncharacterized protein n=1 Tax=Sulfobacillus benefaciens TaxID=453960 RepID=A0A2T2XA05_9FIRM|nr:MAG: hypothetical protein C7B43_02970 [Sulfobacillus benefaciens]